jgi:hypothetical protein
MVRLLETSIENNYSVDELMTDLKRGFSELNGNSPIDM